MFLNPEQCIAQSGLQEGMKVADFGAGSGLYSKAAANRVGHTGHVYAIEVQKELVKKIESDVKDWHVSNMSVIWGDIEKVGGTKIADHSMDMVIVANVLFQVSDKLGLVDEVKRVLRKDGRALIIDWTESFGNMGPTQNQIISKKTAQDMFEKRGFSYTESISTGEHHYGIILTVQ
jgi:ubiquinone/menaquinone biosynthesis C-methylase UbiE